MNRPLLFRSLQDFIFLGFALIVLSCTAQQKEAVDPVEKMVVPGANSVSKYVPLLKNKKVAVVANQTSVFTQETSKNSYTHLVDSLLALDIDIQTVFAPEHGFRGKADAGEHVEDARDPKTNLPIVSLYGSNRKPKKEQLEGVDVVVFDIQDVGVRFYTYIYTMHYVMEACAENDIPVIVLDRPNPNGHYVDGPILEKEFASFVGMHPVPIVYGMTIGEYAQMINGEKWLKNEIQCDLTVVQLENYTHQTAYSLPVRPSPNLPNDTSINLYPSICLFEGTNVSCGRGTETQFQIFGSPFLSSENYEFTFTPQPNFGSKSPKHNGILSYGMDLTESPFLSELHFEWLVEAYQHTSDKTQFFNAFFKKLAGTEQLQKQIEDGLSFSEIKKTWEKGLVDFKNTRKKYLIYKE